MTKLDWDKARRRTDPPPPPPRMDRASFMERRERFRAYLTAYAEWVKGGRVGPKPVNPYLKPRKGKRRRRRKK